MHGLGIHKWLDGKKYTGQFTNNFREGIGAMELPNGNKIEG
jgi:hypothetical protein